MRCLIGAYRLQPVNYFITWMVKKLQLNWLNKTFWKENWKVLKLFFKVFEKKENQGLKKYDKRCCGNDFVSKQKVIGKMHTVTRPKVYCDCSMAYPCSYIQNILLEKHQKYCIVGIYSMYRNLHKFETWSFLLIFKNSWNHRSGPSWNESCFGKPAVIGIFILLCLMVSIGNQQYI